MTDTDTTSAHPLDPQDAFAQLGRLTLADHSLETVMATVARLTKRVVPGADEVSVTFLDGDCPTTVASTGPLAQDLDERQYEHGHGPGLDGTLGGAVVYIADVATETRWPDWTPIALDRGVHRSLSVPVPVQREVSAALNIYSTSPASFDEDGRELAVTFAAYAGVALANMHLYEAQGRVAEQLQTAMQSRAVIEQAKGILMASRRCSAEEAFNRLVVLSQKSNRKLREVAEALVAAAVDGRPGP